MFITGVLPLLQWEHLALLLRDQEHLVFDAHDFRMALRKMASGGDIQPFLALFHDRVVKAIGNKDLRRFDERALKLMLLAFVALLFMRAFAEAWPAREMVKQLVSQLPWGHVIRLVQRVKEPAVREWYVREAISQGAGRRLRVRGPAGVARGRRP